MEKIAFRLILVCLFGIGLSGCFDMKQDFVFRTDGTATVKMDLAVDASLLAMAESSNNQKFCGEEMRRKVEKDGLTGTAERRTRGGDILCRISIDGDTERLIATMNSGELMPGNAKNKDKIKISLTRDGSNYVFEIVVPPMGRDDGDGNNMGKGIEKMFLASMSGRTLAWSVTAPAIVETTGNLSEDGKTASFSLPLAEAFTNEDNTYEFRTVFATEGAGFFGWVKSAFQ